MGLFDKLLKGAAAAPSVDSSEDLGKLRKMADRLEYPKDYDLRRRICDVGIRLHKEGKIIAKPGDPYDVCALIEDMDTVIRGMGVGSEKYPEYPIDEELRLRLMLAGEEILEDFSRRKEADPSLKFTYPMEFSEYTWSRLFDVYSQGSLRPRNAPEARKYQRMRMTLEQRLEGGTAPDYVLQFMDVAPAGEAGKEEIFNWCKSSYRKYLLVAQKKQQKGETFFVCRPQIIYQAVELLFQLDTDAIGGSDVEAMLAAYRRGAEAGNAYAQYKLATYYMQGIHVRQDLCKGTALMRQAAQQDFCLAVFALDSSSFFPKLPASAMTAELSQTIALYEKERNYWGQRGQALKTSLAAKYAPVLSGGFSDIVIPAPQPAASSAPAAEAAEAPYTGRFGQTDAESPFNLLQFPEVMTGPHGVIYRRTSISADSASYWGDDGSSTTLHLADLGATGMSARNSDGYFHW